MFTLVHYFNRFLVSTPCEGQPVPSASACLYLCQHVCLSTLPVCLQHLHLFKISNQAHLVAIFSAPSEQFVKYLLIWFTSLWAVWASSLPASSSPHHITSHWALTNLQLFCCLLRSGLFLHKHDITTSTAYNLQISLKTWFMIKRLFHFIFGLWLRI